jgi:hypothetical protein
VDFDEIELTAVNTALTSDNKIHDDDTARRYGFRGGLVPGVGVYGYLTRPLVAALGADWLKGSSVSLRLRQPVYEGERYRVSAVADEGDTVRATIQAGDGIECASCEVRLQSGAKSGALPEWARHPAPEVGRRPIALDLLEPGAALTAIVHQVSESEVREYAAKTADHDIVYQASPPLVHSFTMLQQANEALARNYALGPWIHTASEIENYRPAFAPCGLVTYSQVVEAYERKRHEYVVLDTLTAADGEPVQRVRHTSIFRVAERA